MDSCGDVTSLESLQIQYKHQVFEAEVITGKAGGVAGGASIGTATNPVTGQTQQTLPSILADLGFDVQSWTSSTGGVLASANQVFLNDTPGSLGIGDYYAWGSSFPKTVPAGTDPALPTSGYIMRSSRFAGTQAREALRRSYAEAGYNLVAGSFEAGGTLVSANDVLLQERTGKAFSGPSGLVTAGTNPASGGFVDVSGNLLRYKTPMYASDYVVAGVTTDQADELQSAMELAASRGQEFILDCDVYVQERDQTLDGTSVTRPIAIYVPSGLQFRRTNDAEIIQLPNSLNVYYTLNFYRRKNIAMHNPVVIGDRDTHLGTTGEAGHVFNITGAVDNVRIYNPVAKKSWGDGYYTGTEFAVGDQIGPTYVLLHEPVTEDCSRNGISRCAGHVDVIRPRNIRAGRIAPMAGIDLEPECADANGNSLVTTGIIESPYSEDCGGYGFHSFINKGFVDVNVTGIGVDRGSKRGLYHKVVLPAASAKGQVVVEHFRSYLAKGAGACIENIEGFLNFTCKRLYVEDSNVDTTSGIDSHPLRMQTSFGNNYALADISLPDYSCRDTRSVPVMTQPYIMDRLTSLVTIPKRIFINVTSAAGLLSQRPGMGVGINLDSNNFIQDAFASGDWGGTNFNVSTLLLTASTSSVYTYPVNSQRLTKVGCKITKGWVDGQLNLTKQPDGTSLYFEGVTVNTGVRATKLGSECRIMTIPGTFNMILIPVSGDWIGY